MTNKTQSEIAAEAGRNIDGSPLNLLNQDCETRNDGISLPARRERAMNDLALIIQRLYGDRCSRNEWGCVNCAAWTIFDAIERLTDGTALED